MKPCGSPFLGLDVDSFWRQMEVCFRPLLSTASPERALRPDPERMPVIALDPPPAEWPDPADFVSDEA
jgi:hypothetical protein